VELDGALSVPMSWQLGETPPSAIAEFHARLDATLARLVREVVGGAVGEGGGLGEALAVRQAAA